MFNWRHLKVKEGQLYLICHIPPIHLNSVHRDWSSSDKSLQLSSPSQMVVSNIHSRLSLHFHHWSTHVQLLQDPSSVPFQQSATPSQIWVNLMHLRLSLHFVISSVQFQFKQNEWSSSDPSLQVAVPSQTVLRPTQPFPSTHGHSLSLHPHNLLCSSDLSAHP